MAVLRRPRRAALVLALAAGLALADTASADSLGASKEYQVKAAFLFHFTQFVQWPAQAFAGPSAPLCVGVLGDDPFGDALAATFGGENARERPLLVRHAQKVEDLASCHVVFISRSEASRLPAVLAVLGQRPILTVSEIDGFARNGGAIQLFVDGSKVRFEIDPAAARSRGVVVGSELLSLGRVVSQEASRDGN